MPRLDMYLLCPNLKDLDLRDFNRKLQLVALDNTIDGEIKEASAPSSSSSSSSSSYVISKLRKIDIDNVSWLNSFPREAFQCLSEIRIEDDDVQSLGEAEEVFRGCSSSLQTLVISNCRILKSVWSGGLEHLIALEILDIRNCLFVNLLEEEERENVISMSRLPRLNSLLRLGLSCWLLVDLESWIQFLVALQSLTIYYCKELMEYLPNWMPKLTSLKEHLYECSAWLEEECQHTSGQYWPYIHHIPSIQFHD